MAAYTGSESLELHNLAPEPTEEWQRLLRFIGLGSIERGSMVRSVEALLRRASELVVNTYNYLLSVPETAAILGWEGGADEEHLAERRQFFALWLSRTLGIDTSDQFAQYLFNAGKIHAGHGPRHIHTPPIYVTGSIGLVQAAFVNTMYQANLPPDVIATASAGWNKYLNAQLHLMLSGYHTARDLDQGELPIKLTFFGRMRSIVGCPEMIAHVSSGATAEELLRKFFNYHPQTRSIALDRAWHADDEKESLWLETIPTYTPKWGWRVLKNGRNLTYDGGFTTPLTAQDTIAIFPPGR